MTQQSLSIPRPSLPTTAIALAVVLSAVAFVLALSALSHQSSATTPTFSEPVVGGECTWARQAEDLLPGIGAEPAC